MGPRQIFFGFSGRLNRAKYWGYSLLLMLVYVLSIVAGVVVGVYTGSEARTAVIVALAILLIVWTFIVWVANAAIGAKRLHDRGKSGWWIFLYYFVPAAMQQQHAWQQPVAARIVAIVFMLVGLGILIWAIIDLGFLRGTAGPNAYGPDPLERSNL